AGRTRRRRARTRPEHERRRRPRHRSPRPPDEPDRRRAHQGRAEPGRRRNPEALRRASRAGAARSRRGAECEAAGVGMTHTTETMSNAEQVARSLSEDQRDWILAAEPTLEPVAKDPSAEWWKQPP